MQALPYAAWRMSTVVRRCGEELQLIRLSFLSITQTCAGTSAAWL
jgi:hypothetical protein